MAAKHAGAPVAPLDFVRAAGRGEILLRAIVHVASVMEPQRPGDEALEIPTGAIPTLPMIACQHLANVGRASWRHIEGHEVVPDSNGEIWRYVRFRLPDDAEDIETTLEDCRVTGFDLHALADEFRLGANPISDARRNADAELYAEFSEFVNNGDVINWDYWVGQMPTWTTAQASRLLCGLDPDVYEDLRHRPNDHDVGKETLDARHIERLANAKGIDLLAPEEWFTWAKECKFKVHVGVVLALRERAVNVSDALQQVEALQIDSPVASVGIVEQKFFATTTKKTPALRAQEALILEWLVTNGYNLLRLPAPEAGKRGVKADAKDALKTHDLFKNTTTVFRKAWERLLSDGAIKSEGNNG